MAPGRPAPRASYCYEFLIIFFPSLARMAAILFLHWREPQFI